MAKKYYQQSITIAGQTATHLKTSVNWLLLLDVGDAIIVGGTRAKIQSVDSATSLTFDAALPAGQHLADFEVSAANVFNTFESSQASASKTPLMAGERGVQGERGVPGERGNTGLRGEKGDKGNTGGMGLRGIKGDKGDNGTPGIQGGQGDPGVRGETGLQGIKGDNGSDGADGIPGGPVGPKGDVGSVGPTGNAGPKGTKGDKGDVGGSGPQGIMGLTGPAGTPGGRGPKGDVGPVGPPRILENNLTSNNPAHALAAPQGRALKALIDAKPDKLKDLIDVGGTLPGETYQLEVDGQGNLSLNKFTEADVTNWKDGGESAPDKEWKFTPTGLNVRVYPQGLAVENAANPGYQAIITPDGLRTVHEDKESALKIGELVLDNGGQHPILAAPMALNVRPEYLDAYNASIGPSSLLTLEYLSKNGAPPEKLPAPGQYVREQKADLSESWVIKDEPTAPGVYVREHKPDGKLAWKKKDEPPLEGLNFRERKADGTFKWSKYVVPDDAIPKFSPVAPYLPRRFVEHNGEIFWNEFAVAPGPFNAAQWHKFTAVENEIPEWAVNTAFSGPISVQHEGKIYHSEVDVPAKAAFDPADWVHEPTEIWQANHQPPYHPDSLVYKDGRVRRAITTPTAATFEEGEWLGAEPATSFQDFNEVTDYAELTWIRHDGKVWWNPDPVAAGAFNETQWKNAGSDGGVPVPVDDKHYLIQRDPADNTKARLVAAPGAGVSARVGELVYKKTAADDLAKGYLAVKPGTTVNGKIDYPVWAAMYPEFISGNDIVFPADVAGMFLRNLGGYAASEGAVQADATDDNGLYTAYAGNHNHHIYYTNGGAGPGFRPSAQDAIGAQLNSMRASYPDMNTTGAHGHSVESNDPETRPVNRAYQLYTIVDSYVATSPMVNGPDLSAYRTLSDQDNIDLQINSTNTQQDTRLNALEAAGGAANTWASSTW